MHLISANQNKTLVQLLFCFVSRSSNEWAKVNEKGPGLSWLGLTGAQGDFHPYVVSQPGAATFTDRIKAVRMIPVKSTWFRRAAYVTD